ncbi:ATP-binding cassette domain-containing protein [Acidicapsa dinghuensis]|uniref:ATP-binding cassette domain-containing protein n=1 Tax=Acidicapsa dinghuensis TaxID=2218256 RepID=A0ABW1EE51_9BACT|nr:ABC transporter ATP-binding protein [Acidicapsa dinghuensis]
MTNHSSIPLPRKADEAENTSAGRSSLRIAFALLNTRQRLALALLIVARIVVGLCDLAVAAAMYLLFLLLQGRPIPHSLWWLPGTTLSAATVTSILVALRVGMDISSGRAVVQWIFGLYTNLLLRLTRGYSEMQWSRFVACNRGILSNHVLHTARDAAEFYQRLIDLTAAAVIVTTMTAALVYQSPLAACAFAVALAAFFIAHRFFIRSRVQQAASSRETSLRMLQRSLADMFSSGKEVRTYRNATFFYERIRKQAESMAGSSIRAVFLPQVGGSLADQGAVLLFLCIIIAVQLRHGDARQVLSLLAFYFVLSRRLIPLISQISLISGQLESSMESVRLVSDEVGECEKYRELPTTVRLPASGFVLQLHKVSFAFSHGSSILRDISFEQLEGEMIVLCGPSGMGKSSLLNLIAGVSEPVMGELCVNRARISYVPQEVPLLDDTIRNNLLFGIENRSDGELMHALSAANLDEFVMAQPLGLETGVGDNGALFSGGQRQRLGLARAFLRGSDLLLLDEATSALDMESERQVLENLKTSGRAVLLVTHRIPLRAFAQRVFLLLDGTLVEETEESTAACKN